jgi:hypothetical protein
LISALGRVLGWLRHEDSAERRRRKTLLRLRAWQDRPAKNTMQHSGGDVLLDVLGAM